LKRSSASRRLERNPFVRSLRGCGVETWLADALRTVGLTVIEDEGWKSRGHPFTFDPKGVVFHHTASGKTLGNAPSLRIVREGRPDLGGPLCHVLVARNGDVYTIAAGYAAHAGLGGPFKNIPENSGNKYLLGVEVENDGLDEEWTEVVLDSCDKVFAAILKHLDKNTSWCIGHKEWAPDRKIDPDHGFDMDEYREELDDYMAGLTEEDLAWLLV
jgi:hypothetical protein